MHIRRVLALGLSVAVLSGGAMTLSAQAPPKVDKKEQEKRSKNQQEDVAALVQLVDSVTTAEPVSATSAATDQQQGEVDVKWVSNHYIKGQDGATYIPFSIQIERPALSSANAALYIRAVNKNAAAAPAPAAPAKDDKDKNAAAPARVMYAWDNANFVSIKDDGKMQRALALPGGDYDLFIAVKDQATGDKKQMPKTGLLRRTLHVPDFKAPVLATSSVMLGSVEPIASPLPADQQQENPYTFGTMKILPSADGKFAKGGELSLIFWIYGVGLDQVSKKPDVTVEYAFHQKTADGEKYFNKTAPQELNGQTLPPQFDLAAGHQLPGSLAVPLMSFPAGDYRLEIKITDKPSGKSLTQNVNFTVNAT